MRLHHGLHWAYQVLSNGCSDVFRCMLYPGGTVSVWLQVQKGPVPTHCQPIEVVPFSRGLIIHIHFRSPCTSSLARCLGTLGQMMHCLLSFIPTRYQVRMSE